MAERTPAWGDLGNGLYRNPVLNADFSDPDIVRVGDDYYLVCSEFHYMGIPVLHSRDLVNWTLVGRVFDRLDIDAGYDRVEKYGKGSWAPAIRWHQGQFFVYFCTPDEGLFVCTSTHPSGPWTPPHALSRTGWWEDPCPFWDGDQAYLGRSIVGAGPIILHRMSPDGLSLLDEGQTVYIGKIAEGTKIYRREGWYYLVIPEGGVELGWQTVLRSTNLYGPYEKRVSLATGRTKINGPHQGALVDTPGGESWFFHFQSRGALGRVCHLQPVVWVDGWPEMGAAGEPVEVWTKPAIPGASSPTLPATSDAWTGSTLGWQWQWNHNPVDTAWSLAARPGFLRLGALGAPHLKQARGTLTQRLIGPRGRVEVSVDGRGAAGQQVAGLGFLGGGLDNWIGLRRSGGRNRLEVWTNGVVSHGPLVEASVELASEVDLEGRTVFQFRRDDGPWVGLGGECVVSAAFWKGVRVALFCFDPDEAGGWNDFGPFRYDVFR